MNIIVIIAIVVVGFILWNYIAYVKFKRVVARDKQIIMHHIKSGMTLSEAIEKAFLDLNASAPSKLHPQTISSVSQRIATLQNMMNVYNVIEIYSTFIYRYFCRNSLTPHPNVKDEQVLYAAKSMEFNEVNGGFELRAELKSEEISKKFPVR